MPDRSSLARDLLRRISARQPACGTTRVLSIDGPSGAGKTSLAHAVVEASGAPVLHLEDLYRGWHGLESAPPAAADVLAAVAVDRVGHAPTWDWVRERLGPDVTLAPAPLVVVEGVGAGARTLAPFVSLLVWLDGPEDRRRSRALARDGDTYAPWWDVWAAQERQHFAREGTRERADLVAELAG